MNEVYEFLKGCGTYYLATVDGDRPRVRPFGTVNLFDGKLYFQTGKKKDVSKQMHIDPKVEICAFSGDRWLRVEATAVPDERRAAKKSMLDAYPDLRGMYDEDDGNTEVWYLSDATATFSSFTSPAKVLKF